MVGFGKTYPEVWLNLRAGMAPLPLDSGVHLCLRARTMDEVDAFYAAAIGRWRRLGKRALAAAA
jgi:hypothetical protein